MAFKNSGRCESCYKYEVERAFQKLPAWPTPLTASGAAAECSTCDLHWPKDFLFRDSRGFDKCVICRKWELMHGVEMLPSAPIHCTLDPGQGIRCFKCGKENHADHHQIGGGAGSFPRTSLFCWDCRYMEERYAAQGFVNIAQCHYTAYSF